MPHQRYWNENLKKRNPEEYAAPLKAVPSLLTVSMERLISGIRWFADNEKKLFEFIAKKAFRKQRFMVKRFSRKALADECKRVTKGEYNTCVGIGDWSRTDGLLKGAPSAPNKAFVKELKKHARLVVMIDEYRTSKRCSACKSHTDMENARLPRYPTRRQRRARDEKEIIRNGEFEEIAALYAPVVQNIHTLVRCCTNECTRWWNRDVNSARNHLLLTLHLAKGLPRPMYLCRGG